MFGESGGNRNGTRRSGPGMKPNGGTSTVDQVVEHVGGTRNALALDFISDSR